MATKPALLVTDKDGVRLMTINRPEAHNAWSKSLEDALGREFSAADADPAVKVVVLTGAGTKAFSSGADLKDPNTHRIETVESYLNVLRMNTDPPWLRPILELSKPVIGAVNGFTVGAGCSIAMACDILLGSENAEFRFPQASLGILPIFGGAARLAQWIGRGRAMDLVLTGRPLQAEEACRIGLLSRVLKSEELMDAALDLAAQLAAMPVLGVRLTKESLKHGLETDSLRSGSAADMYRYLAAIQTEDSLRHHAARRELMNAKTARKTA